MIPPLEVKVIVRIKKYTYTWHAFNILRPCLTRILSSILALYYKP